MEEIKSMSDNGLKFLMDNEGCKLTPYLDSVNVATVGFGSTYYEDGNKVKITDPPITQQRAKELFQITLKHYEQAVYSNTIDSINQNQFDALTSFVYNIGVNGFKTSTVLRLINSNGTEQDIRNAFLLWDKPPEIIGRRKREVELYFTPIT